MAKKGKKNAKKSGKKHNKSERKLEKEILWILGFLVFLVLVFFVASSFFKSLNTFEYEGLTFTKEKIGEIPVYHYFYYFEHPDLGLTKYNLYLRNDPRHTNVTVKSKNSINFRPNKPVFVSVNATGLDECRHGVLGVSDLASFFSDNGLEVRSVNMDPDDPVNIVIDNENNVTFSDIVTCETRPQNPVMQIHAGEESKITIDDFCYDLSIANCEVLEVTERFKVQTILDSRMGRIDLG